MPDQPSCAHRLPGVSHLSRHSRLPDGCGQFDRGLRDRLRPGQITGSIPLEKADAWRSTSPT